MKCENFDNIVLLDKIDSTNSYLKKNSALLPQGTVVFAGEQTSGKGRLSRKWFGEKGKSIACSFLIKDIFDNVDAIRLSFLFSIAVRDALTKYIDYGKISLKWPNDILVSGKKICGILSEYSKGCVVIGIGINAADFIPPQEIGQPWTSVESESGHNVSIADLQEELVETVNIIFSRYCTNELSDIPFIWFREADIINKNVTVLSGSTAVTGEVISIDDKGILNVFDKKNGEIKSISFGDITYND